MSTPMRRFGINGLRRRLGINALAAWFGYQFADRHTPTICLVGLFKNERHALKEWIDHYLKEGVDHFFLTDNGSDDGYIAVLDQYLKNGIVSLNINPARHQQVNHLNYYLNDVKRYDWVIVVDLDEFLYARSSFSTIKHFLSGLQNNTKQVYIPWKMFGSDGHLHQPENIIHSFTKRNVYDKRMLINGKCITRTRYLKKIGIHQSHTNAGGVIITSDGSVKEPDDNDWVYTSEEILKDSVLHLNHYAIQSWEFFSRVKMTRGDASSASVDYIRDKNYFYAYDNNIVLDEELHCKNY
jgi:hypothetical protein